MFSIQRLLSQHKNHSFILATTMTTALLLGCSANATSYSSSTTTNTMNTPDFKLDSCEEDYEDVNFCSDKFIKEYTQAISKPVNFNYQYVLHFIPSEYGYSEVVAIDPVMHHVIPLGVEIKPTSKVQFSANSDRLCFSGDISGYRQDNSYSKVCYTMEADPFINIPGSSGMTFVQSVTEF